MLPTRNWSLFIQWNGTLWFSMLRITIVIKATDIVARFYDKVDDCVYAIGITRGWRLLATLWRDRKGSKESVTRVMRRNDELDILCWNGRSSMTNTWVKGKLFKRHIMMSLYMMHILDSIKWLKFPFEWLIFVTCKIFVFNNKIS